jgi:hypothetical protein
MALGFYTVASSPGLEKIGRQPFASAKNCKAFNKNHPVQNPGGPDTRQRKTNNKQQKN